MSNRAEVLNMIGKILNRMKNTVAPDERITLIENVQILSSILKEVTNFECSLIAELDVD
jgi:hypothetical protein